MRLITKFSYNTSYDKPYVFFLLHNTRLNFSYRELETLRIKHYTLSGKRLIYGGYKFLYDHDWE